MILQYLLFSVADFLSPIFVAKVIFLHLSVILFTGGVGVSASVHAGTPHPLGADTPQSRHPLGADTPWSRHPQDQTRPGTRHPSTADTPWDQTPPTADTPWDQTSPTADTPPRTRHPQD